MTSDGVIEVVDKLRRRRFEVRVADEFAGDAEYRDAPRGGVRTFTHTLA